MSALKIQVDLRWEDLDEICSHLYPKQVNTNFKKTDKVVH